MGVFDRNPRHRPHAPEPTGVTDHPTVGARGVVALLQCYKADHVTAGAQGFVAYALLSPKALGPDRYVIHYPPRLLRRPRPGDGARNSPSWRVCGGERERARARQTQSHITCVRHAHCDIRRLLYKCET